VSLTRFVLVVEYNGTRYHGFQWQVGLPTIQAELERAASELCGQSSRVISASRTDAGVHAKGQVVSFRTSAAMSTMTVVKGLNHYLPSDVAVKAAYTVGDGFKVRRDALSREYCYHILNSPTRSPFSEMFALFMPKTLDIETMRQACQMMVGEHDFASFATSLDDVDNTTRSMYEANMEKRDEFLVLCMVANSFIRHQIRNTMGLLIRLGLGKLSIEHFRYVMEERRPGLAGPTAPAKGLCLTRVNYARPLDQLSEAIPDEVGK